MEHTYITTPLYDSIKLSKDECRVLDSKEMQRLRYIRQLGCSSHVYPSAVHTRFSHSLGVMHLAGKYAQSLGLSECEVRAARLAGLLHDVGHGPFSHVCERVSDVEHEEKSCEKIEQLEHKFSIDADRIKSYVLGEDEYGIVAGTVDADRLDYLVRDSQFSSVEHGMVDAESLIEFATIVDNELVFEKKAIQALREFLMARLSMMSSVYGHHAVRIAETMLERALSIYNQESETDIFELDDYTAHANLLSHHSEAKWMYEKVAYRDLFKRARLISDEEIKREYLTQLSNLNVEQLEHDIAEAANVRPKKVLVDPPNTPSDPESNIKILSNRGVTSFSEISSLPGMLEEERWQTVGLGIYADKDIVTQVSEIVGTFGFEDLEPYIESNKPIVTRV